MRYKVGAFRIEADEDLNQMEVNRKDGYSTPKSTCVHAQQYVEKMLKEKIVELGDDQPPPIHNLNSLLSIVEEMQGCEAPEDISIYASTLNSYYIHMRYPGPTPAEATPEMAEVAHSYAISVVAWLTELEVGEQHDIAK